MHEALAAAGVRPPYIAAGHSLGGFFALLFAHRYRRDVSGLVLVDAAAPAVIRPFGFGVLRDGKHLVDIASAAQVLEGPAPDGTIVLVHGRQVRRRA